MLESGTAAYPIHDFLMKEGFRVVMANPSKIRAITASKSKTAEAACGTRSLTEERHGRIRGPLQVWMIDPEHESATLSSAWRRLGDTDVECKLKRTV